MVQYLQYTNETDNKMGFRNPTEIEHKFGYWRCCVQLRLLRHSFQYGLQKEIYTNMRIILSCIVSLM